MEFKSEIQTLAQVEHLSLVKFYGYLEHDDERIVIVEYVPNGTLREHLDCELHFLFQLYPLFEPDCLVLSKSGNLMAGIHGTTLDLATRLDIATDVAHAITYLHMYTGMDLIRCSTHLTS